MFVYGGLDSLRRPNTKVDRAAHVTEPLKDAVAIDADTVELIRVNGAVQVGAGLALATGHFTRLCSALLAGSLVLTTLAGHRFWEEKDANARGQQTVQFLKNMSMLGGLLAVVGSSRRRG
jgi:uncharacterized membrane protein YphA (DoxX/SURF4 family)